MKYIDTHAHLNLSQFTDDYQAVFDICAEKEVGVINVGTRKETSQLAVELANEQPNTWAIIGIHPCSVIDVDPDDLGAKTAEPEFDYGFYKELATNEKTVGIGECGFDYFHNAEDTYEQQREVFLAQIALANEVGKPLMLHLRNSPKPGGRDAYDDALDILKTEATVAGNAHFYAGTTEQAKAFFDIGYTISFTGVITFAKPYQELVQYAPLDLIHGETDCPYVTPVPYRGQRCEPWMVQEVYKKIAEFKELDEAVVQEQLYKNAHTLWKLP
jgi:TatD DNase family protein